MTNQMPPLHPNKSQKFSQDSGFSAHILIVLLLWFLFSMVMVLQSSRRDVVPYSQFLDQVKSGQLKVVSVGKQRIAYTLKPLSDANPVDHEILQTRMTVQLPADATLLELLRSHNIEITAIADNSWSWLGLLWPLMTILFLFNLLNELEKRTVTYHEAGHAIIGAVMPGGGRIETISIVPRGIAALGYTLQLPEDDRVLMMEGEIRGQLATLLGGRAAEELTFNKVSTGASDDIQKAPDLAERCITLCGMSKTLSPVAVV